MTQRNWSRTGSVASTLWRIRNWLDLIERAKQEEAPRIAERRAREAARQHPAISDA